MALIRRNDTIPVNDGVMAILGRYPFEIRDCDQRLISLIWDSVHDASVTNLVTGLPPNDTQHNYLVVSYGLLIACKIGNSKAAKEIIDCRKRWGLNLSVVDKEGLNAWQIAIKTGDQDLVAKLLNSGVAFDAISQISQIGEQLTGYHMAAWCGQSGIMNFLVQQHGYVASKGQFKLRFDDDKSTLNLSLTPIQASLVSGYTDLFTALIDADQSQISESVIGNEAKVDDYGTLVHLMIAIRRPDLLEFLVTLPPVHQRRLQIKEAFDSKMQWQVSHNQWKGCFPLGLAGYMGDIVSIDILIKNRGIPTAINSDDYPPLFFTIDAAQAEAFHALASIDTVLITPKVISHLHDVRNRFRQNQVADPKIWTALEEIESKIRNLDNHRIHTQYDFAKQIRQGRVIKNVVFKGGGPKGIAYVGALKEFGEFRLQGLERTGGASAGAISATLVCLRYTPDQIEHLLTQTNMSSFVDEKSINRVKSGKIMTALREFMRLARRSSDHSSLWHLFHPIQSLLNLEYLSDGQSFLQWLQVDVLNATFEKEEFFACREYLRIGASFDRRNMTFGNLKQMIDNGAKLLHLHVIAIKLSGHPEVVDFNSEDPKYCNVRIADAVRASMSIPGIFQTHTIAYTYSIDEYQTTTVEGKYADGGMILNFPLRLFDPLTYQKHLIESVMRQDLSFRKPNPATFGFSLSPSLPEMKAVEKQSEHDITGAKDLIRIVCMSIYYDHEELAAKFNNDRQQRSIDIDIRHINAELTSFNLPRETIKQLKEAGQMSVAKSPFFRSGPEAEGGRNEKVGQEDEKISVHIKKKDHLIT